MPGQPPPAIQEPLVPPVNFAMVCPGVYRSGYPTKKNYRFIRALRLRTIIYLCPEEYAESNVRFCEENGITILRFSTEGNKEPFMDISEPLMHRILSSLVDTRTHPILIHCNKGKHRTGTVVACLRLLHGWSLVSIFQEYRSFAGDKVRMRDQQYVELYHPIVLLSPPHVAEWVCITPAVTVVGSDEELLDVEARQLGWSLVAPPSPDVAVEKGDEAAAATTEKNTDAAEAVKEHISPGKSLSEQVDSEVIREPANLPQGASATPLRGGSRRLATTAGTFTVARNEGGGGGGGVSRKNQK